MSKNYFLSFIGSLLFTAVAINAQNPEKCATIAPTDPAYEIEYQKKINEFKHSGSVQTMPNGKMVLPTKDIPVIFHIIHDGTATYNISPARILEQLKILNDDFAGAGFSLSNTVIHWANSVANTGIKFCLTTRDKNGAIIPTPTTNNTSLSIDLSHGINRVNINNIPGLPKPIPAGGYSKAEVDQFIKPNVFWDPNNFLNVYVVPLSGSLLGYAVFPDVPGLPGITGGNNVANLDGVVCRTTTVGNSGTAGGVYNRGRTLTHEIGHWIGLRHTWGDTTCGTDYCQDTPETEQATAGCPPFPQLYGQCATTSPGAMTSNFMDYTNDSCMYLFTYDQALRMQTALQYGTFRKNLGTQGYCTFTPTGSPLQVAGFPKNACVSYPIQLYGWAPYSADSVWWETPSATPNRTSGSAANVVYAANGNFTATFKGKYPGIAAPLTKTVSIVVNTANCTNLSPFAMYGTNPKDTCLGNKVQFKNYSSSALSYQWTFLGGSPGTSTAKNPQVTYNGVGKYPAVLQAYLKANFQGASSTYFDTIEIKTCKAIAIIDSVDKIEAKTFCNYEQIKLNEKSIASDSVYWKFPLGYPDNSTLNSPSVSYAKPGKYIAKLYAKNDLGLDSMEIELNIVYCNSSCNGEDTIANFKTAAKNFVLKNTGGWGYIAGHNSDQDIGIAEKYRDYPTTFKEIRGAIIYFARKYDGTQPSDYKIRVRDADLFGYPNYVIAQANLSMQQISTGPGYKAIEIGFNPKAYVSNEEFFVSIENLNYPPIGSPYGSQDTIAVYSTADNPNTIGTAFKKWSSDGQWHAVNESISENKNISLAIYPIVCTTVGLEEIYNKTDQVVIYPNPATDQLYLGFNSNKVLKYAYQIFDNTGKVIFSKSEFRTKGTEMVDIRQISPGFYFIKVINNGKPEYYRFTKE